MTTPRALYWFNFVAQEETKGAGVVLVADQVLFVSLVTENKNIPSRALYSLQKKNKTRCGRCVGCWNWKVAENETKKIPPRTYLQQKKQTIRRGRCIGCRTRRNVSDPLLFLLPSFSPLPSFFFSTSSPSSQFIFINFNIKLSTIGKSRPDRVGKHVSKSLEIN